MTLEDPGSFKEPTHNQRKGMVYKDRDGADWLLE